MYNPKTEGVHGRVGQQRRRETYSAGPEDAGARATTARA